MHRHLSVLLCLSAPLLFAAPSLPSDEETAARRAEIPLTPQVQPNPQREAIVAVGHGGRVLLSVDDGASWEQVFKGLPGGDHGAWSTKSIGYTDGVFVVVLGWPNPTAWLASEDGYTWRHLTDGSKNFKQKGYRDDPTVMPTTWGLAGGNGTFVSGGFMDLVATPDFGKTWYHNTLRQFRKDGPRKLSVHHVGVAYLGDESGRFLAYGDDRSRPKREVMTNLFASDDGGQSWAWLQPTGLDDVENQNYKSMVVLNGNPAMITKDGSKLYVSGDGGQSWSAYPTGVSGRGSSLSVIGYEFWVVTEAGARATRDGETWRDLPEGIPSGTIVATEKGTLLNVDRTRSTILRSIDQGESWQEVHSYEMGNRRELKGLQGLQAIQVGKITAQPIR